MKTAAIEQPALAVKSAPLKVGALAPYFSGIDQNGEFQSLDRIVQNGPFVLIFYRGHWCDYCASHLMKFQSGLDNLTIQGFPLILVTPEKKKFIHKTRVKFPIIHDNLNYITTNYKVASPPPETLAHPSSRVDFSDINDADNSVILVPATYIIGDDGTIKYGHFDLNYTLRSSFKEVAKKVQEIKASKLN